MLYMDLQMAKRPIEMNLSEKVTLFEHNGCVRSKWLLVYKPTLDRGRLWWLGGRLWWGSPFCECKE